MKYEKITDYTFMDSLDLNNGLSYLQIQDIFKKNTDDFNAFFKDKYSYEDFQGSAIIIKENLIKLIKHYNKQCTLLRKQISDDLTEKYGSQLVERLKDLQTQELLRFFYSNRTYNFMSFVERFKSYKVVLNEKSSSEFRATRINKGIISHLLFEEYISKNDHSYGLNPFRDNNDFYRDITLAQYFLGNIELSDSNNHSVLEYSFKVSYKKETIYVNKEYHCYD